MTEKERSELELFKDIFLDYVLQLDALTQLFIQKGFITNDEFTDKLDQVRKEYNENRPKMPLLPSH